MLLELRDWFPVCWSFGSVGFKFPTVIWLGMSEITVETLCALQSVSGVGCAISVACARDILEDVLGHLEHLLHGFLLSFFHGLGEGSIC